MHFRDLPCLARPLYDDFRGLPQVDFQRVGRKLASAWLPNGRIDHDVIQIRNADSVLLRVPWDCSASHGYVRRVGKRGISLRTAYLLRFEDRRKRFEQHDAGTVEIDSLGTPSWYG
jgi:hypothetical protein